MVETLRTGYRFAPGLRRNRVSLVLCDRWLFRAWHLKWIEIHLQYKQIKIQPINCFHAQKRAVDFYKHL